MTPSGTPFGPFVLDVPGFRLTLGGQPVPIQPKALELLVLLVRHAGEVVSNDDLRRVLWPDVVVTDQSLRQVVLKLREALGEHRDLVETVPRKGLRVARPVESPPPPAERDAFVGRTRELAELRAALAGDARLVTVHGPAGVGKTRLLARWCREVRAVSVELSAAWTLDELAHAVATALRLPPGAGDVVERVGRTLAERGPCWVALDNFEHVARHAVDTVGVWLERAPDVRFVVTSRDVLGVPGEAVWRLDPLSFDDAVALFGARAAVRPEDADAVTALVERLDRLPLAIELAAARVRVMSPGELLARMGRRFDLLAAPDRRDRHATLRAALAWSWELLAEPERAGLVQLSVFVGGFPLAGAEAVLEVAGVWEVDVVQALVDRSWLRRVGDRFEWLVSLQEYAAHQLDLRGGRARAEARHGAWCATLDGAAAGGVELPNLVAACRRAIDRAEVEVAVRCLVGAWEALALRGPFALGIELAAAVRALPAPPGLQGRAAWVHGEACRVCGRPDEAVEHLTAALAGAREGGDRASEGVVLRGLGIVAAERGRPDEAGGWLEQALALWREVGAPKQEALALHNLAALDFERGRLASAAARLDGALEIYRTTGDRRLEGLARGARASVARALGRPEAVADWHEALVLHREVGDRRGEAIVLRDLGNAHLADGALDEAARCYDAALALHRALDDRRGEAVVLGNLGRLDEAADRPAQARARLEQALAIAEDVSDRAFAGALLGRLGLLDARDGRHDEARARLDRGEALLRAVAQPLGLADLLVDRAEADHLAGRSPRAALAEAATLAAAGGEGAPIARRVADAARRFGG